MLNRSLFEDMVDAHWTSLNPELAIERLRKHDIYSRLLRADTQRKFPEMFDGRKPPTLKVSNEDRKEMRGCSANTAQGPGPGSMAQTNGWLSSCRAGRPKRTDGWCSSGPHG